MTISEKIYRDKRTKYLLFFNVALMIKSH